MSNQEINDETIMWFGKHKGEKLINVPGRYLLDLYNSGKAYGKILEYLEDNLECFKKEVG